ncbi:hypothetical protein V8F20_009423 [Naviculisporaceae sp. PSN 640]
MRPSIALVMASAFLITLVSAKIKDVFTVQSGANHGGCDNYMSDLDLWLDEAIQSLGNTVKALETSYNEDSKLGRRVRKSMFWFFQVPQQIDASGKLKGTANALAGRMREVFQWLSGDTKKVKPENYYLFCGSDFLVQKNPQDVAKDYKGEDVIVKGEPLPMENVPGYKAASKNGDVAWWSGDRSDINGYWFEAPTSGANYCRSPNDPKFDGEDSNLAFTGIIKLLTPTKSGTPQLRNKQLIIICPRAFKTAKFRNSFKDAAADPEMKPGQNLEWALPRSATFTHEAFHIFHGTLLNEGWQETYGLAKCVNLANPSSETDPKEAKLLVASARKNPENFVYLSSALHYLTDTGLAKRWDFCEDPGSVRVFDPNSEDEEMGDA